MKKNILISASIVVVGLLCIAVYTKKPEILFVHAPKVTDTGVQIGAQKEVGIADESGGAKARLPSPLDLLIRSNQTRLSYTDAVSLYQNKTIQFGADCQPVRGSTTSFAYGNEIMVDNKDTRPIFVQIGNFPFAIGPQDFAFLILKQKGTVSVDCGIKKNVLMLEVQ